MKSLKVTAPGHESRLFVMNDDEKFPRSFVLEATRAQVKAAIRIAGGCSGMSQADKRGMFSFFETALRGVKCLLWSGGTRTYDDHGSIDPIVTEIPAFIAERNPGSVALGTLPRVDRLAFVGEYGELLAQREHSIGFNTGNSANLIVQANAEDSLDWDGDVLPYLDLMVDLKKSAGFHASGLIVWNGGKVTKSEVELALKRGLTVFLVQGSGRAADELANSEIACHPLVSVVSSADPGALNTLLKSKGFIR